MVAGGSTAQASDACMDTPAARHEATMPCSGRLGTAQAPLMTLPQGEDGSFSEQLCHGRDEPVPLRLQTCLAAAGVDTSARLCW